MKKIQSQAEYNKTIQRLEILWEIVDDPNNMEDPASRELLNLADMGQEWEDKVGAEKAMDGYVQWIQ